MYRVADPVNKLIFGCSSGAIGMERMDFVLLMDYLISTPSRGWTLFSPMGRMDFVLWKGLISNEGDISKHAAPASLSI